MALARWVKASVFIVFAGWRRGWKCTCAPTAAPVEPAWGRSPVRTWHVNSTCAQHVTLTENARERQRLLPSFGQMLAVEHPAFWPMLHNYVLRCFRSDFYWWYHYCSCWLLISIVCYIVVYGEWLNDNIAIANMRNWSAILQTEHYQRKRQIHNCRNVTIQSDFDQSYWLKVRAISNSITDMFRRCDY